MRLKSLLRKLLPESALESFRRVRVARIKQRFNETPKLSKDRLAEIVTRDLGVRSGDSVLVHSGLSVLNVGFPRNEVLPLLLDLVGRDGTLVFPTYPNMSSADFLSKREIFDVRNSPSYTGYLTEQARLHPDARRSLHPTKSVVAIGPAAADLTSSHHESPFPYDRLSPYHKLMNYNGRSIGIGVASTYLSSVCCVDDTMKERYPVEPYLPKLFEARCINADGKEVIVETYAPDPLKTHHVPPYLAKYVSREIAADLIVDGRPFFRARTKELHTRMIELAERNITFYQKQAHKPGRR